MVQMSEKSMEWRNCYLLENKRPRRPKRNKNPEHHETNKNRTKLPRKWRVMTCGICHKKGHNKKGCPDKRKESHNKKFL